MNRSFDNIARSYHALEKLCFGESLQQAREFCLPYLAKQKKALILGDGDGRFAAKLLAANPQIKIHSIDSSKRMVEIAESRTAIFKDRITHSHADALTFDYPFNYYDTICLHFFIDCFTQAQVEDLLRKILPAVSSDGIVAYSDFNTRNATQSLIVKFLYLAFRALTNVQASRLPHFELPRRYKKTASMKKKGGLIFSEIWRVAEKT